MYLLNLQDHRREMVRLGKFFSLVHNEYVKVFKKTSTKIMIVLILLGSVAFSGLLHIILTESSDENYKTENYISGLKNQIDEFNELKPDGYKTDIDICNYIINNNISYDSWQASVASDILDSDELSEKEKKEIFGYIEKNDDKGYCKYMSENASDSITKWAYKYRTDNNIGLTDDYNKQNKLIEKVSDYRTTLSISAEGTDTYKEAKDGETVAMYQLENKIYTNTADYTSLSGSSSDYDDSSTDTNFWKAFMITPSLISFIGVLMVVIAGGSVASEFSQGTIKFLLINPVKRWKILMAKYFTCISIGYIMIAVMYIIFIPVNGIINGFGDLSASYIYVKSGEVQQMSSFLYVAREYLTNSVEIVVISTMSFAISSLVRSSALAIGISVFAMFAGNTITALLSQLNQDWARYLIFSNVDLVGISQGNTLFPQQTVGFAICVIVAHMAVFILTAWDGFTKKSV